jgi:hypothetical protein
MNMQTPSLRFEIANVYGGLATARGVARAAPDALVLEFEMKDAFVGMLKTAVREVRIPLEQLSLLDLRKGWFTTRVVVGTHTVAALHSLPGSESGRLELQVARADRRDAETLVSMLTLRISERELEQLNHRLTT